MLTVEEFAPIGARVYGLTVDRLMPVEVDQARQLLARHGVLVISGKPEEPVDDHAFVRFLRSFGELMFTEGETPVPGFADLNVVSNVGRATPPRSVFHVDTSYVRRPPAYTALRAHTVPAHGGATLFTNQYAAFDTLPDGLRTQLADCWVRHVVTGVDLPDGAESEAMHPLFRVHPVSRRTALFLSTPQRCVAVTGLSADESRETIDYLFEHSTRPDNVYRHRWREGDVVIWDNRAVMHRADHSDVVGDRVMHRGMVADRDWG
ncbi:MAG TPA: TauD/TfdA family dioxygenase [Mycobacterium sp.]|nr:TauD/TfdA family dioxygenase [Mycobacterium sp.]